MTLPRGVGVGTPDLLDLKPSRFRHDLFTESLEPILACLSVIVIIILVIGIANTRGITEYVCEDYCRVRRHVAQNNI